MRRSVAAAATCLVLLAVVPAGGHAQQAPAAAGGAEAATPRAPGMLTTRTFSPPPQDLAVYVAPYDDSELNLKLQGDFEGRLADKLGARVTPERTASFLFLFESEVVPAEQAPGRPSLGSARVDEGGAEVNVNVWSSSQDSVLGGRQQPGELGSSVFHINAVLRDKASGEVVWQGDAYYDLSGPETERVARALVAPLVDKMGQSVVREPLQLD
ncbi:hypothetical protein [Pelagibius sp. 7325]|uniref:hypothetical protein n=1 Tax=Pelagibius sp. 7325 TaxID=3131994 RepID=UPI0030EC75B0